MVCLPSQRFPCEGGNVANLSAPYKPCFSTAPPPVDHIAKMFSVSLTCNCDPASALTILPPYKWCSVSLVLLRFLNNTPQILGVGWGELSSEQLEAAIYIHFPRSSLKFHSQPKCRYFARLAVLRKWLFTGCRRASEDKILPRRIAESKPEPSGTGTFC